MHDLVLTGGHLLDPANNTDEPADLAIRDGRFSEVGRVTTGARRTVDVFPSGPAASSTRAPVR